MRIAATTLLTLLITSLAATSRAAGKTELSMLGACTYNRDRHEWTAKNHRFQGLCETMETSFGFTTEALRRKIATAQRADPERMMSFLPRKDPRTPAFEGLLDIHDKVQTANLVLTGEVAKIEEGLAPDDVERFKETNATIIYQIDDLATFKQTWNTQKTFIDSTRQKRCQSAQKAVKACSEKTKVRLDLDKRCLAKGRRCPQEIASCLNEGPSGFELVEHAHTSRIDCSVEFPINDAERAEKLRNTAMAALAAQAALWDNLIEVEDSSGDDE